MTDSEVLDAAAYILQRDWADPNSRQLKYICRKLREMATLLREEAD